LPQILQKRGSDFGKAGQSKWTHLVNEDTIDYQNPLKVFEKIQMKNMNKMAGLKGMGILDRPISSRSRRGII